MCNLIQVARVRGKVRVFFYFVAAVKANPPGKKPTPLKTLNAPQAAAAKFSTIIAQIIQARISPETECLTHSWSDQIAKESCDISGHPTKI